MGYPKEYPTVLVGKQQESFGALRFPAERHAVPVPGMYTVSKIQTLGDAEQVSIQHLPQR
jgi:hypothetical protein